MQSFGICILVVLSIFSGKVVAPDATPQDVAQLKSNVQDPPQKTLENNVKDAQTEEFLDKNLTDVQVETIINNLFKVVDVHGNGVIRPSELADALQKIPEITCTKQTTQALITAVEQAVNPYSYRCGTLSNNEAIKYVNGATGRDRMIRLREILTGKLNA